MDTELPLVSLTGSAPPENVRKDILFILVPAVSVPLLVACLFFLVCSCRHKKQSSSGSSAGAGRSSSSHQDVELALLGQHKSQVGEASSVPWSGGASGLIPGLPVWPQVKLQEISASALRFLEELGEDRFGKVYKGHLYGGLAACEPAQLVTIKTVRERGEAALSEEFRQEATLRSQLQHQNLVCLLGVVTKEQPLSMVFASSSLGDLHEYLVMRSPNSDIGSSDDGKTFRSALEQADFLHIVTQVAAGMEYLSSKQLVHKDLAARNVLVFDKLSIKILNLGFCRNVYAADYYSLAGAAPGLPVRWMAPEAIVYGTFSSESDAWAYGVLLWETFSYGLQPYCGCSNQEVVEMVCSFQLLGCPDDCPPWLYSLMLECWSQPPAARPPFKDIHARLRGLEASSDGTSSAHMSGGSTNTQLSHAPASPASHNAFHCTSPKKSSPFHQPHFLPLMGQLKAPPPVYLPGYQPYPYLPSFYPLQIPVPVPHPNQLLAKAAAHPAAPSHTSVPERPAPLSQDADSKEELADGTSQKELERSGDLERGPGAEPPQTEEPLQLATDTQAGGQ